MSLFMLVLLLCFPLPHFLPVIILGGHSSAPLHYAPLDPLAPLDSSSPPGSASESESESDSKSVAASDALFFAPSKLMPA